VLLRRNHGRNEHSAMHKATRLYVAKRFVAIYPLLHLKAFSVVHVCVVPEIVPGSADKIIN
jgi:hypothetical protein